ncbi:hypothetical protein K466DRAFT_549288 [Polyporus arcularius HHB13444]|uniref:F-box domain-containing protein n=1 Tax=Polyporus arcularius HHB13444 TaxID=1314778 RepID=A0A5C3PBI5_9APHY|nr:hypothetical protein K466DRAFT_549288 [Polyporus arcularius HHB13444]
MGQYWEFLNISLGQAGRRNGGAKWLEFFFCEQPFLVRSLTVPYPSDKVDRWLEGFTAITPRDKDQGLLRVPNEVLIKIVELVPSIRDRVCLALTCKRLLSVSRDQIEELKKQLAAPWAGGRLICIGDYTDADDLPEGLLTEEKKRKLKWDPDSHGWGGMGHLLKKHTPLFLGTACLYRDIWGVSIGLDKKLQDFLEPFSKPDHERFLELYDVHYPARDDWVVCNLSLGKYVRAKAVAGLSGKPDAPAPFLPKCSPDLGHAIMYKICWSSDAYVGSDFYGYKENIARGKWAGHRFVITTMERMPDAPKGKEWEDISKQVAKDLKCIWSENEW